MNIVFTYSSANVNRLTRVHGRQKERERLAHLSTSLQRMLNHAPRVYFQRLRDRDVCVVCFQAARATNTGERARIAFHRARRNFRSTLAVRTRARDNFLLQYMFYVYDARELTEGSLGGGDGGYAISDLPENKCSRLFLKRAVCL